MATSITTSVRVMESAQYSLRAFFDQACARLHLQEDLRAFLSTSDRVISFRLPFRAADGTVSTIPVHRVQHNTVRGPALGPLTFTPGLTIDDATMLAENLTWTNAVWEIPFGGAFAVAEQDPSSLSSDEFERLVRQVVHRLEPNLGIYRDILNCADRELPEVATWAYEQLEAMKSALPIPLSGKSMEEGGLWGGDEVEAVLTTVMLREVCEHRGQSPEDLRVACMQPPYRAALLRKHLSEAGFKTIDGTASLQTDCDVLIVCGPPGTLNHAKAGLVRARLLFEASPLSITAAGESLLQLRGVQVVPDLLAATYPLVSAYFEWLQNVRMMCFTKSYLFDEISSLAARVHRRVRQTSENERVNLRTAAYMIAVERVARAEMLRCA